MAEEGKIMPTYCLSLNTTPLKAVIKDCHLIYSENLPHRKIWVGQYLLAESPVHCTFNYFRKKPLTI